MMSNLSDYAWSPVEIRQVREDVNRSPSPGREKRPLKDYVAMLLFSYGAPFDLYAFREILRDKINDKKHPYRAVQSALDSIIADGLPIVEEVENGIRFFHLDEEKYWETRDPWDEDRDPRYP